MDSDKIIQQLVDKLEEIHNQTCKNDLVKEPLYHYTNIGGLKGILESKKIWFTDYMYLNDPTEIQHGKDCIFSLLNKYRNEYNFINKVKNFLDDILKEKNCRVYICSFCKRADYLPAWRYYGDDGHGFAIEFSSNFFKIEGNSNPENNKAAITKVYYENLDCSKEQWIEQLIKDFLNETQSFIKIIKKNNPNNSFQKHLDQIFSILCPHLLLLFPKLKHPDYRTEEEHRLFLIELEKDGKRLSPPLDTTYLERPEFPRIATKTILKNFYPKIKEEAEIEVPYLKMKFQPNDIQKIYVGPTHGNNFNNIKSQLQKWLPIDYKHIQIELTKTQYKP